MDFLLILVLIILAVILSPLLLLYYLAQKIYGYWLNLRFLIKHIKSKKNILFVYSKSPIWEVYIQENIIPGINHQAIILNWSERSKWNSKNLETKLFSYWGGDKEFNPIAIVFTGGLKIKIIRFYKAFKNKNHGSVTLLEEKQQELFTYL